MTHKSIKADLHRLVDELPEEELYAAKRYLVYLRSMGDPVFRSLEEAPYDDEPTTPEEDESADEAWREYLRGDFYTMEEVKREFLT